MRRQQRYIRKIRKDPDYEEKRASRVEIRAKFKTCEEILRKHVEKNVVAFFNEFPAKSQ